MVVTIPLLIPLQGPAPEGEAGDPLHEVVELGVGPEGARVERVTELGGTLHVWVSSDAFDPRLQVELPGRNVVLEDGDSGGGTTAWLSLDPTTSGELRHKSQETHEARAAGHVVAALAS